MSVNMVKLVVEPSQIGGEIKARPSKSYTHRLLSIALLADGESDLLNPLSSLDTRATVNAVRALGGEIGEIEGGWRISGTSGEIKPEKRRIDVLNSGTTLRLMTAVSSLSPDLIRLSGDESILKRPMGPLVDSLRDLGADARCEGRQGRPPVVVGGGLEGGETRITGAVSSQFISALIVASPYSEVGVDLEVEEELRSKPYVRITLKTLKDAGADVKYDSDLMSYSIPGGQTFDPFEYTVPGDFSSAAFLLGAGALSNKGVKVTNLNPDDVQGDKRIVSFLREFGADVETGDDYVKVSSGGRLQGIDVDCSDTPDLVPVLAVLGAVADGQTRIYNVPHLRFKEVDRLKALSKELGKLGVRFKEMEDGIKVFGGNSIGGANLNSYGDHRMVMALAIAGLVAEGKVEISDAGCVDVSYPEFVEDIGELGAKIAFK